MPDRTCSIDGCENTGRITRGWCRFHYRRFLEYGDPLRERESKLDELRRMSSRLTNDCIIWPYATAVGYASLRVGGKTINGHSYVTTMHHGQRPRDHDAAHQCGNRGCVNPRHLRWATRKENCADTIRHDRTIRGERHPTGKLTENDVHRIRIFRALGFPLSDVGRRFGVSPSSVHDIDKRRTWAWLS